MAYGLLMVGGMGDSRGFTLIELLIVVAIIGIVAAIAIPGLQRAKMSGNEASAIGSMRTINSSQQAFASTCGNSFYTRSLADLTAPPGGTPFISPDLMTAAPAKSGYDFTMGPGTDGMPGFMSSCNGLTGPQLVSTYVASARPQSPGMTGSRYFFTNTLATIFFDPANAIAHTQGNTQPSLTAPAGPIQ